MLLLSVVSSVLQAHRREASVTELSTVCLTVSSRGINDNQWREKEGAMILKGETGVSDETVMQLLLHKVAAVWKDR